MSAGTLTAPARRAGVVIVVVVLAMTGLVATRAGVAGALLGLAVALVVVGAPLGVLLLRERRRAAARAAVASRPRHCTCCAADQLHRLDAVDTAVDLPTVVHT